MRCVNQFLPDRKIILAMDVHDNFSTFISCLIPQAQKLMAGGLPNLQKLWSWSIFNDNVLQDKKGFQNYILGSHSGPDFWINLCLYWCDRYLILLDMRDVEFWLTAGTMGSCIGLIQLLLHSVVCSTPSLLHVLFKAHSPSNYPPSAKLWCGSVLIIKPQL